MLPGGCYNQSQSLSRSRSLSLSLSRSLAHSLSLSLAFALSLSLSLARSHSLTLSRFRSRSLSLSLIRARSLSLALSLSLSLLTLQNTFTQQTCTGRTVPLEGIACLTRRESIAAATEFATSGMEQSGMLGGSSGPALFGGRVSSSPITKRPDGNFSYNKKNSPCNTAKCQTISSHHPKGASRHVDSALAMTSKQPLVPER